MNIDQVVTTCQAAGVRLVRYLYCDNGCTIRGKLVPMERLASRMVSGQGLTVAMQAMNMLDQLQPVEGWDLWAKFAWCRTPTAWCCCPMHPTAQP